MYRINPNFVFSFFHPTPLNERKNEQKENKQYEWNLENAQKKKIMKIEYADDDLASMFKM